VPYTADYIFYRVHAQHEAETDSTRRITQ